MAIFLKAKSRTLWAWVLAGALLLGVGAWGISENLARARYRRMLDSMLEKSFYELVGGVNSLEVTLSKLAVSDQPAMTSDILRDVARYAENTGGALASLPVSQARTAPMAKLINQVGDWSSTAIKRIADGKPLSTQDYEMLEDLRTRLSQLNGEFSLLSVHADAIRDLERTAYFAEIPADDASPLESVEQLGQEYPTLIYDGPFSDGNVGTTARGLSGPMITQAEAVELARLFYGEDQIADAQPDGNAGGTIPSYGVKLRTHEGMTVWLQVAQRGGRVHWMMSDFFMYEEFLDVQACMEAGKAFLEQRGYAGLSATYAQRYDGLCTVNYAAVGRLGEEDIMLYPDLIKAQISMTDGRVVGVEATNYLMNHYERNLPSPLITVEEARSLAGNNLEIDRVQLALIPTEGGGELLTWECAGLRGGERYLVYIDALGGSEKRILKIIDVEGGQLTM